MPPTPEQRHSTNGQYTLTSFFFVTLARWKLFGIRIEPPIGKINAFAVQKSIFGSGCMQSFSDFGQSARAIK